MSVAADVIHGDFANSWQRAMSRSNTGNVVDCYQNVYQILERHPALKGAVAFDDFSQIRVKRRAVPWSEPGEWTPQDDQEFGIWCSTDLAVTFKSQDSVVRGVTASAQRRHFHPVRDWLESLAWDGNERVGCWLTDCLGAKPGRYSEIAGRHWLLNMVARVYEPGCIMRAVPVLEGAQERGKSTALRTLAGDDWFSDSHLDVGNKDMYELIQGVWLYEIGEMAAFNKAEANRVKQMISSGKDSWVPKWVRGRTTVRRQVMFSGTTNEQLYLRDWTGNTRFVPIKCEVVSPIRVDVLKSLREQLFAEAVVLFKAGTRRYPTQEESDELFGPEQADRLLEHPWIGVVSAWISNSAAPPTKLTMREVMEDALGIKPDKMTMLMAQDAGRVMAALGWERRRAGGGDRGWFYAKPEQQTAEPENDDKSSEAHQDDANPF